MALRPVSSHINKYVCKKVSSHIKRIFGQKKKRLEMKLFSGHPETPAASAPAPPAAEVINDHNHVNRVFHLTVLTSAFGS